MEEKMSDNKFIPLAIGSGILFMLPSLLLSITAGIIVTREAGKF